MERDIKRDREWCEDLEIRRWTSVSSRTEYGGDDSWIEACLTHDDTKTIGGDDVYEMSQALLDYLALCEHLERMLEAAIRFIRTRVRNPFCPPGMNGEGCENKPEDACDKCWSDYLDQKAKEGEGNGR